MPASNNDATGFVIAELFSVVTECSLTFHHRTAVSSSIANITNDRSESTLLSSVCLTIQEPQKSNVRSTPRTYTYSDSDRAFEVEQETSRTYTSGLPDSKPKCE